MNKVFKFFEGQFEIEEPDIDEWWTELEVEAALERAGAELRRQREELERLHQHLASIRNND